MTMKNPNGYCSEIHKGLIRNQILKLILDHTSVLVSQRTILSYILIYVAQKHQLT